MYRIVSCRSVYKFLISSVFCITDRSYMSQIIDSELPKYCTFPIQSLHSEHLMVCMSKFTVSCACSCSSIDINQIRLYFRPAFVALRSLRAFLRTSKVLAVTATANQKDCAEIAEVMLMKEYERVSHIPDRLVYVHMYHVCQLSMFLLNLSQNEFFLFACHI